MMDFLVLRSSERIALANDKYAALERKAKELADENAQLRAENAELRSRQATANSGAPGQIDETAIQILVLLSKQSDLELTQIARQLGINPEVAAFHVEELEAARFVHGAYSVMHEASYSLDQEGRRFLIKNGHMK